MTTESALLAQVQDRIAALRRLIVDPGLAYGDVHLAALLPLPPGQSREFLDHLVHQGYVRAGGMLQTSVHLSVLVGTSPMTSDEKDLMKWLHAYPENRVDVIRPGDPPRRLTLLDPPLGTVELVHALEADPSPGDVPVPGMIRALVVADPTPWDLAWGHALQESSTEGLCVWGRASDGPEGVPRLLALNPTTPRLLTPDGRYHLHPQTRSDLGGLLLLPVRWGGWDLCPPAVPPFHDVEWRLTTEENPWSRRIVPVLKGQVLSAGFGVDPLVLARSLQGSLCAFAWLIDDHFPGDDRPRVRIVRHAQTVTWDWRDPACAFTLDDDPEVGSWHRVAMAREAYDTRVRALLRVFQADLRRTPRPPVPIGFDGAAFLNWEV